MQSLLVFVPSNLHEERPGCMYGLVCLEEDEHDKSRRLTKFFILGRSDSVKRIGQDGQDTILGYYHGLEGKREYWDRKLPDWIELRLQHQPGATNLDTSKYEYSLSSVLLANHRLAPNTCHAVLILYDRRCLLGVELHADHIPLDHLSELREILERQDAKEERDRLQHARWAKMKQFFFTLMMFIFLKPIIWSCQIIGLLGPILKYSSLFLHLANWLQNAKWTLSTLLRNKRFTLKTRNYIFAMCLDVLLGHFFLKLLLHYLGDTSRSEILFNHAERIVESLKGLVNWLMGSPAGLKLNPSFNHILGKFFLYHIHLWWSFLYVCKPMMEFAIQVLLLLGRLGVTFQISIIADLLALVTFHTYCIYVYAARLFNIQVQGLTALFRLFLGKKKNPLRKRVDSCRYQPDQLFVGTILFTILLFLMPTTWVYYLVFTVLRLIMIGLGGFMTRLKFYLQIMPVHAYFRWLFGTVDATGSIGIDLIDRKLEGPIMLKTKAIILPWSKTWKKSIPDTISIHPPIEWSKISSHIFWGQLLYPL